MNKYLNLNQVVDMFDEYIDGIYEPFILEDLKLAPSEILREYPEHYDKQFFNFVDSHNITCEQRNGQDVYIFNTIMED